MNSTNNLSPRPQPVSTTQFPTGVRLSIAKHRPPLILAICAGVLLLLVTGLVAHARSSYSRQAATYERRVQGDFDYFTNLKARPNHIADIQRRFDTTLAAQPHVPKVLWVTVATTGTKMRVAALASALGDLRTNYVGAVQVANYGDKALPIMGQVTGTISTPADAERLRPIIARSQASLAQLDTPAAAKEFAATKQKAYQTMLNDIDGLQKALSDKSITDYTSYVQKLTQDSQAISTNQAADQLRELYKTTHAKADAAYDKLMSLLGRS